MLMVNQLIHKERLTRGWVKEGNNVETLGTVFFFDYLIKETGNFLKNDQRINQYLGGQNQSGNKIF